MSNVEKKNFSLLVFFQSKVAAANYLEASLWKTQTSAPLRSFPHVRRMGVSVQLGALEQGNVAQPPCMWLSVILYMYSQKKSSREIIFIFLITALSMCSHKVVQCSVVYLQPSCRPVCTATRYRAMPLHYKQTILQTERHYYDAISCIMFFDRAK